MRWRALLQCEAVGPHRFYLGNCRNLMPLLRGRVAAVVTDPPYGISYQSRFSKTTRKDKIAEDDVAPLDTIRGMAEALVDGGALYACTSWQAIEIWMRAIAADPALTLKTTIVWDKLNHGFGDTKGDWGNRTELVLFAHRGRHLLRLVRPQNVITIPKVVTAPDGHPTLKPVELMERLILASTDPGDLVFDPFMGSGATAVAAARTGRVFVGCDVDPRWWALSAERTRRELTEVRERPRVIRDGDYIQVGSLRLSRSDAVLLADEMRRESR